MTEFLHIEKVPLDEITNIYINELRVKFNIMLESFKKAIIPADQMEFSVKRELSFVIDLSKRIDIELDSLGEIDNTPLPEVNGLISYFDYLAIQSTADDLESFIPDSIKNKDAYWKRVKLVYRKSLFEGYMWFLQGMLNTVFDTSLSPAYWNIRTTTKVDKIRKTTLETAPDVQAPEVDGENKETESPEEELPVLISVLLKEGLLDNIAVNGKYLKMGDKKDMDIIKWIFDCSGYEDSLTGELYMRYVKTSCKASTISDYIRRLRRESRQNR